MNALINDDDEIQTIYLSVRWKTILVYRNKAQTTAVEQSKTEHGPISWVSQSVVSMVKEHFTADLSERYMVKTICRKGKFGV